MESLLRMHPSETMSDQTVNQAYNLHTRLIYQAVMLIKYFIICLNRKHKYDKLPAKITEVPS